MIEVWFFLALSSYGIAQAGPFHTQSQCEYVRDMWVTSKAFASWREATLCYRGVK